jgi:hypothetical protein
VRAAAVPHWWTSGATRSEDTCPSSHRASAQPSSRSNRQLAAAAAALHTHLVLWAGDIPRAGWPLHADSPPARKTPCGPARIQRRRKGTVRWVPISSWHARLILLFMLLFMPSLKVQRHLAPSPRAPPSKDPCAGTPSTSLSPLQPPLPPQSGAICASQRMPGTARRSRKKTGVCEHTATHMPRRSIAKGR